MVAIKKRFDEEFSEINGKYALIIAPIDNEYHKQYILCRNFNKPIAEQAANNELLQRFIKKFPLFDNFKFMVIDKTNFYSNKIGGNIMVVYTLPDYLEKMNLHFTID